jgi:hypothetical protein
MKRGGEVHFDLKVLNARNSVLALNPMKKMNPASVRVCMHRIQVKWLLSSYNP